MDKEEYKLEKKKAKAKAKLEKAKTGKAPTYEIKESQVYIEKTGESEKEQPWYKNPGWVRAIAAIVSAVIAIIALYFTVLR